MDPIRNDTARADIELKIKRWLKGPGAIVANDRELRRGAAQVARPRDLRFQASVQVDPEIGHGPEEITHANLRAGVGPLSACRREWDKRAGRRGGRTPVSDGDRR